MNTAAGMGHLIFATMYTSLVFIDFYLYFNYLKFNSTDYLQIVYLFLNMGLNLKIKT